MVDAWTLLANGNGVCKYVGDDPPIGAVGALRTPKGNGEPTWSPYLDGGRALAPCLAVAVWGAAKTGF